MFIMKCILLFYTGNVLSHESFLSNQGQIATKEAKNGPKIEKV